MRGWWRLEGARVRWSGIGWKEMEGGVHAFEPRLVASLGHFEIYKGSWYQLYWVFISPIFD